MVHKEDYEPISAAYEIEAYRRLYWHSVDKNLCRVEFDRLMIDNELRRKEHKIEHSYRDFYCPSKQQTEILDKLFKEDYVSPRGVVHKIRTRQIQGVRPSIALGISPYSSLCAYAKWNPYFTEKLKQYLTEEEIKELDEY